MSATLYKGDSAQIPAAPYYVLSNDPWFSGWGYARNQINTLILPCESWQEAERVADYARSRGDQKNVRIVIHKPTLRDGVCYSLHTRDDYSHWYGVK